MKKDLETVPYDFDDEMISRTRLDQISRVRVYQWPAVSVVIGRGGKQELELRRDNIAVDGVTLFKRHGGGCSVVLDPGNLIVSVGLALPGLGGISTAFNHLSDWMIEGLGQCGVPNVEQQGVSDLTLNGKKIGGSCVYRTKNLLYYSTTLLVQHDAQAVDRYLKHPPREPDYRQGRAHSDFMVSLESLHLVKDVQGWRSLLAEVLESRLPLLDRNLGGSG